jgi:hypothetical protein
VIYECTDCSNCASFSFGWRLICLAEELEPDEVCSYFPIGTHDALECLYFDEDFPIYYSQERFSEAERYSVERYKEITYQGIREWCIREGVVANIVEEKLNGDQR